MSAGIHFREPGGARPREVYGVYIELVGPGHGKC